MKFYEKIKEICNKYNKVALFVDMDGTIVEYKVYPEGFVTYESKELFIEAEPVKIIIDKLEELNKINNFLPVQVYSQRENPNIPPAYAYKTAINQERVSQENFERRYRELRTILERYKQQVQLERLDAFYSQFKLRQGQVRETNGKFPTGH